MRQLAVADLPGLCAGAATPPLLLDVREDWEFGLAAIHLDAACTLHLPMGQIPARLAELGDPGRPVVCICHHGMRSAQVGAFLERQGWSDVHNLAGGIDAWSAEVDPRVPRY